MAVTTNDDRGTGAAGPGDGGGSRTPDDRDRDGDRTASVPTGEEAGPREESVAEEGVTEAGETRTPDGEGDGSDPASPNGAARRAVSDTADGTGPGAGTSTGTGPGTSTGTEADIDSGAEPGSSRRPPAVTTDTARPEGGGRAAPGDAPAPARQWPLLAVLGTVGLGLVIVGTDPFAASARVGTLLIGAALLGAAVLRRVIPSVGMLAVRSRFTDLVTYSLFGTVICLLALMLQPDPWLEIPFLEDLVHFFVGRE
ncbi:DUF3017 domain-containing protein [Streptomyces sp. NPDC058953]|uniref:DUF3017 domain-containing protein n=1 Tax=unclassified Streptomyces TaxID=2593676 RepID=UPI0036983A86